MEGMDIALSQARLALEEGEVPVGAALFHGDSLLWADHNRREQNRDPTAHAEMLCLRHGAERLGDWRLNDCILYVTLEPCPMCAGAIVMSRIGKCVFGAYDPEKGCCGSVYDLPADPAFGSPSRWCQAPAKYVRACEELMVSFFSQRRKDKTDG